jgi:hypothetical protein
MRWDITSASSYSSQDIGFSTFNGFIPIFYIIYLGLCFLQVGIAGLPSATYPPQSLRIGLYNNTYNSKFHVKLRMRLSPKNPPGIIFYATPT